MLDHEPAGGTEPSGHQPTTDHSDGNSPPAEPPARRRTTRKATNKQQTGASGTEQADSPAPGATGSTEHGTATGPAGGDAGASPGTAKKATRTRRRRTETSGDSAAADSPAGAEPGGATPAERPGAGGDSGQPSTAAPQPPHPGSTVLFVAPEAPRQPERTAPAEPSGTVPEQAEGGRRRRRGRRDPANQATAGAEPASAGDAGTAAADATGPERKPADDESDDEAAANRARRRGRRGRGRGKGGQEPTGEAGSAADELPPDQATQSADGDDDGDEDAGGAVTRRRRRRRRKGSGAGESETGSEDGVTTVVKVREPRNVEDEVRGVSGSTRLEAKRQRRRGGRDQRRTRPPVLSESEFLARREAVDRVMVIRQSSPGRSTQIGVLEDDVLVEHYVSRVNSSSMVGSVYLGKVQNVLPSMEAAFIDVGRGRNAVLYAGEVNWDASGLEGRSRSIEQALSSGDSVLVQVTKDPVGHKGARLTSNLALSGRHLVYTPYGNASGISRKLPENERRRLRDILKQLVPEGAGVIVRTAAESASSDELERDVKRLQAQWEDIQAKAAQGNPPALLYSEPDLVVRVVRDLFNEDFRELVIEGDEAYGTVEAYLSHVSPDLVPRLRRHTGGNDVFSAYRIDEQILKGLDRKVFLPSGGHLVFDRTEAMTVIDVNTGKYTGTGGNLEETVTRNNLEAAEEIVRQLRLRDIGGIIVIDFIDMVLESNRDLVLRRLTECLGRDRTKHQVTEITSLGLVQMTRKRVGAGLLEAFSEPCDCCKGRGVVLHAEPVGDGRQRSNQAAERVKAVASASTGTRRRGKRSAAAATVAEDDGEDTMGYDLSRYEEPAAPAPEVAATEPVEPLSGSSRSGPGRGGRAVGGAGTAGTASPANGDPHTESPDSPVGEIGLSSVLRRFRRRGGGRHR